MTRGPTLPQTERFLCGNEPILIFSQRQLVLYEQLLIHFEKSLLPNEQFPKKNEAVLVHGEDGLVADELGLVILFDALLFYGRRGLGHGRSPREPGRHVIVDSLGGGNLELSCRFNAVVEDQSGLIGLTPRQDQSIG